MKAQEFEYELPKGRIAVRPLFRRDSSRLMFVDRERETVGHFRFKDIENFLDAGDLLILNDTRVMPFRLYGRKTSGGRIELLLCNEIERGVWRALGRANRPFRREQVINLEGDARAEIVSVEQDGFVIVRFLDDLDVISFCMSYGHVPLPPYIDREPVPSDSERYQTVYAQHAGSCAAPTAGLHFTQKILERLALKGVKIAYVTLRVGPGTFRPISADNVEDHRLEPEFYSIPLDTVLAIFESKYHGKRVVACGTTVARALESWAKTSRLKGFTDLFIYPGFRFDVVDALITNFHLPRSSLLLLVSAFCTGDLVLRAYREAIECGYRFYSYGDAMLIV